MNSLDFFLQSDPLIRIPIYAAIGCVTEVLFTAIIDLLYPPFLSSWNVHSAGPMTTHQPSWRVPGRDPRAVGYSFLWMLPCYGILLLSLEPVHLLMHDWNWILRGFVYLAIIWFGEFLGGWVIKKISGRCPWDYSYSRFSVKGFIRWDFAPLWFGFGFVFEYFHDRLVLLTPPIRAVFGS